MEKKEKKYTVSKALARALANSELLLVHSTEYGLEIEKEHIKVLTDAKEAYENDQWTKEIEIEFWLVYKQLSKLIYPVTIDSLNAAQETDIKHPNRFQKLFRIQRRQTVARRSVKLYTTFAIVTMFIMLFIHIYFSIGTIRLNRIQKCNERASQIDLRYDELMLITGTDMQNPSAEIERTRLENELYEINDEKKSNIKLLEQWLHIFKQTFLLNKKAEKAEAKRTEEDSENGFAPMLPSEEQNSTIEVIQESQNYALILGLYVLPLFFGLLGAVAFVLRDLVLQTKKMVFSKESNLNYTLRLILGTLAGLAVGLFWSDFQQQQSFMMITSLSPLIVAFLAGLSVEYVFSGIEKLISNFIEKGVNGKNEETK